MLNAKVSAEKRIVERLLSAFEEGKIQEKQLEEISSFANSKLKSINDRTSLIEFLSELSCKWKVFQGIDLLESVDIKADVEEEIYSGVLTLAKHGKVAEAIKLAKTATLN